MGSCPFHRDDLIGARRAALAGVVRQHREPRGLFAATARRAGWLGPAVGQPAGEPPALAVIYRLCSLAAALGIRLSDLMRAVEDSPTWPSLP